MKLGKICLLFVLYMFSHQSIALSTGGWGDTKIVVGNLKPTPGCKNKEVAAKQASVGSYRFKKHTKVLCQQIAYGWSLLEVQDSGEVVCETCEGEEESEDNYRCYVKNVKLMCGITSRGY
ncbi:MAG: hypothetical protein ABGX37_03425 [Methylococcales bacterium]